MVLEIQLIFIFKIHLIKIVTKDFLCNYYFDKTINDFNSFFLKIKKECIFYNGLNCIQNIVNDTYFCHLQNQYVSFEFF